MAELIKIFEENPSLRLVRRVADKLRQGAIVIYPTDTVYGMGCALSSQKAIRHLARLKGQKVEKANLSFIFKDLSNLSDYIKQIDKSIFKVLKSTLPGPYTFILPASKSLPSPFKRKKTIGIRIPDNAIVQELVSELGCPLLNTSIRDDDEVLEYATDPELIYEDWKKYVDVVINGGFGGNRASTVVDFSGDAPKVIREGQGALSPLNLNR